MLHYWCSNQHSILSVFSTLWPCDPTAIGRNSTHHWTQCSSTCSGSRAPTPVQMGLTVKGSRGRPPCSPMRIEIGSMLSFQDCLGSEPSVISSYKPWLQICRGLPTFPKCWQAEEAVFLGRPLRGLSLTSPITWKLAFSLEMILGLISQHGFAKHHLEVSPSHRPDPDQSNVAYRFLEKTSTDHCSRVHVHSL